MSKKDDLDKIGAFVDYPHSLSDVTMPNCPEDPSTGTFKSFEYYKRNKLTVQEDRSTVLCPDCKEVVSFSWLPDGWRIILTPHPAAKKVRDKYGHGTRCVGGRRVFAGHLEHPQATKSKHDAKSRLQLSEKTDVLDWELSDPDQSIVLILPARSNIVLCPHCGSYAKFELSPDKQKVRILNHRSRMKDSAASN